MHRPRVRIGVAEQDACSVGQYGLPGRGEGRNFPQIESPRCTLTGRPVRLRYRSQIQLEVEFIDSPSASMIVSNALKLFANQGYAATSIQQIARASGVSKAGVFHHFRTKRDLYLAAIESAHEEFAGELEDLPVLEGSDDRLRTLMAVHLEYLLRNADVARLVARELLRADLGTDERAALGVALNKNYQRIARALDASVSSARTPVSRTRDVALLMLSANLAYLLLGNSLDDLEGSPGSDRTDFVRRMSHTIVSGIVEEDVS